ncbi:RNA/RNP complex-1-interacting phosphatase isoform X3 [Agrilus planipennis]|uniref:RNA/RNP complex-1-interacting phosphatase isoform X3 n=1 Tax=Agrilus planipennis TaxID=224129 RepID=A0A7F5R1F1_AGRPL|nr:RNA/RNP complex-1-interacting phosphatase isoform X3 [Agrilus planipennis]
MSHHESFGNKLIMTILQHSRVSDDEWFTPSILLQKVPNLKLVIDLTNTDRYYNVKDITGNGVFHVKIKCPGGGTLPAARFLDRFYSVVDNFVAEYGNDHVIGVHCTHGLNRTGYFVCKYMATRMRILPEQAIKDFQMARGHTMNRPILIDDILNIFNTTTELRVENYFNTLGVSEFNFRNAVEKRAINKNRFDRNRGRERDERNFGSREIVNWRIKSTSKCTSKFFRSWRRSDPQTAREYERNRKNFSKSLTDSTSNSSWQQCDRRGNGGGKNDRRYSGERPKVKKQFKRGGTCRSISNEHFYSQRPSTSDRRNNEECRTINDEG